MNSFRSCVIASYFRLMKEELTLIERNHTPKDRSLNQLKASLEAMQTTKEVMIQLEYFKSYSF